MSKESHLTAQVTKVCLDLKPHSQLIRGFVFFFFSFSCLINSPTVVEQAVLVLSRVGDSLTLFKEKLELKG